MIRFDQISLMPPVMTVKDAAGYLRLSEATILRLAAQGDIQGSKVGRQWRFSKDSILNLIKHPELLSRAGGNV